MKKITSLLLTLTLCATAAFAQLPSGSTAQNFTGTDLDGNTWELYDLLDQGKTVFLNVSVTWAAPCWAYHNTNALRDLYNAHGPSGDNSAMVLFIEADDSNGSDCLSGLPTCTGGTQGNFLNGHNYPFIDGIGDNFNGLYGINYFPTIYKICPDKVLEELGQVDAAALEAELFECPVTYGLSKLITGSVVKDDNSNCSPDAGEVKLSNWSVTANGQNNATHSTVTNANGIYKIWVDSTNAPFEITFAPPNALWSACLPFPTTGVPNDTNFVNHAAEVVIACPQLSAQIGTPLLRRCFPNDFNVQVCNQGSAVAENAFVEVVLPEPEFLPVSGASLPYTVVSPGVYHFDLGDLEISDCVSFTVTAAVSCDTADAQIGQTLCFEAHAFPDSLCEPTNAAWNGANVSVSATCNNGQPEFSIQNTGTAPMSQGLEYIVIEDDVMRSEGTFQLSPGEEISINDLQGDGSTWRVEAAQVPGHPVVGSPSATLEGCTTGSTFTTGFALGYPVYDPSPAHDVECLPIIGSWDPNDKTGFPLGLTDQNLISKNTDLDYLIRFQNTGNDTAFNIVVRDTLSNNFDAKSIRLGASSHPYEYALEGGNVMVFTFKNIKLVDSFANEPASHGFLKFKISQKANLPDGTLLTNSAAIYFDFNSPVITNTSLHRVGKVPHVGLKDLFLKNNTLEVFPNPLNGAAQLRLKTELPTGTNWTLYDFSGKRIASGNLNGNVAAVGKYLKTNALYHIEFRGRKGEHLGGATLQN